LKHALALSAALACLGAQSAQAESIAFFYGQDVPGELFTAFDRVVVEPEHRPRDNAPHAHAVAYLSVGEVAETSPSYAQLDKRAVLGRNPAWKSAVMDLTAPAYADFLLEKRFAGLWAQGYRSFFLDTMDSYQLVAKTPEARAAQEAGLVSLIYGMAKRHPDARLYVNRGFEVLPRIAGLVHGVVAESLFSAFRAESGRYEAVPPKDTEWLLGKLREVHDRHGLPVIVIDYAAPAERDKARALAQRIAGLGFTPWVADGGLHSVGVGEVEIVPRRVLVLSDGPVQPGSDADALGPVLEHLGCVPVFHDLSRGLPAHPPGSLRGVVVTRTGSGVPGPALEQYLTQAADGGARVVLVGAPGVIPSAAAKQRFGLEVRKLPALPGRSALSVAQRDAFVGFEAEPPLSRLDLLPLQVTGPRVKNHLTLRDEQGNEYAVVVSAPWGGALFSHFLARTGLSGERAWAVDPYAFFAEALGLADLPRPDLTTEQGLRLATVVVRPDGLSQTARSTGRPRLSAVLPQVLKPARTPFALDLTGEAQTPAADRKAAASLGRALRLPAAVLPPAQNARAVQETSVRSLSRLGPATSDGQVHMPWPADAAYVPEGVEEIYPFARVKELWARTESPRRLTPIALDLHAYAFASPGGQKLIQDLDSALHGLPARLVLPADYAARAQAFDSAIVVRDLSGRFGLRGAGPLRTLRIPASLGNPDPGRSVGLATSSASYDGSYVSFAAEDASWVGLTPHPVSDFALDSADVEILRVERMRPIRIRVRGRGPSQLRIRNLLPLASCSVRTGAKTVHTKADAQGRAQVTLPLSGVLTLDLTCDSPGDARD
jgi:hypothetical protein